MIIQTPKNEKAISTLKLIFPIQLEYINVDFRPAELFLYMFYNKDKFGYLGSLNEFD